MITILHLLFAALPAGCATPKPPRRFAWVTGLKPERQITTAGFTPIPGPA